MPFSGSSCSDKGFMLSTDALLAVILIIAFMSFDVIVNFDRDIVAPVSSLGRSGRDALVSLDENTFVFWALDQNLTAAQQMDLIEQKVVELLPVNAHYRIELERYSYNPLACQPSQTFETCFQDKNVFPARGEPLPSNRTLASEKKVFFRKGAHTFCSIGETSGFKEKNNWLDLREPLMALFSPADESERFAWLAGAGDANISFSALVNPSGVVSCDQDIRVDLNVTVLGLGRPPVDVMLLMDRSGSMSWGGRAAATGAYQILLDNNVAFVADGSAGVRSVDINNPGLPNLLGQYNTPGISYDVDKNGNYVFLADGGSGFRILNAQNPLNIISISAIGPPTSPLGTANGVASSGNFVFIASTGSGTAYDVNGTGATSGNSDMRIGYSSSELWAGQSFITSNGVISGVELYLRRTGNPSDLNVHLRTAIDGTDIVSVGYPAGSVGTSYSWKTINLPSPVLLSRGTTYFVVLTTSSSPSSSNYYRWQYQNSDVYPYGTAYQQTTQKPSWDLLLRAYYVYGGIEVIDVTNKATPFLAGINNTPMDAQKIVIQGNYLYLSDGTNGLKIFDITNPRMPLLLGSRDTTDADGLFVSGNYAYVADHAAGLRIIDVSNKSNPTDVNFYNTPGTAYDVWMENNIAYVADGTSLQIINVSNPSSPFFFKSFATPYTYRGVVIRNNWAFMATGSQGVVTIDLSMGPRINQAKGAGSAFLDYNLWKTQDQIGLSSFSSTATLDHGLTTNRQDVNTALYALVANGGTNMADGIRNATAELTTSSRQNPIAKKFQVMLSDGQANVGDDPAIAAQEARDVNVVIFTIGFGADADANQLTTIANITGGQYYFAQDQNALAALYLIIAEEIGEVAGQGSTQIIRDANLLVPIPPGSTITDFDGGSLLQIGGNDYIYYFIGDLNKSRKTWSGYFIMHYDCNSAFSCTDENRVLPPDGTVFEWKDVNGLPRNPIPWDSNALIFLKYRDLTLRVLKAVPGSQFNILLDMNAINAGYLSTPATQLDVLLGNPLTGTVLATVPVQPFACGKKEPGCAIYNQLFFDVDSTQQGELFVVINRDKNISECPNNNVVRVFCSMAQSEFVLMRLWVWK